MLERRDVEHHAAIEQQEPPAAFRSRLGACITYSDVAGRNGLAVVGIEPLPRRDVTAGRRKRFNAELPALFADEIGAGLRCEHRGTRRRFQESGI